MQYLLSAAQMRSLDKYVIEKCGIPGLTLMENAARCVSNYIIENSSENDKIIIFCGKGNNGGDGLAVARLVADNRRGKVVMTAMPAELSPDANANFELLPHNVEVLEDISDKELTKAAVVIDAMLGTGATGKLAGKIAECAKQINRVRNGNNVVAIDLPTGVNADTGETDLNAILAKVTLTLAYAKPGNYLYPGARNCGTLIVCDIGFPADAIDNVDCCSEIFEISDIKKLLPVRTEDAHKTSVGWVLAIAGSQGMTGAAIMTSMAACRAGAGLVKLALPASLLPVVNATIPSIVCLPMPEHKYGGLSHLAVKKIQANMKSVKAVLIGPGMSSQSATANAIRKIIQSAQLPIIIDADAITAIAGFEEMVSNRQYPTIITPHPGEMSRLLNVDTVLLEQNRFEYAKEAAKRYNSTIVFKGTPAIIASPDGKTTVNVIGSPVLAVAGSGDMLAGIIASLISQGLSPLNAAITGCYIGSTAAKIVGQQLGNRGVIATDIIESIPSAMKSIAEHENK